MIKGAFESPDTDPEASAMKAAALLALVLFSLVMGCQKPEANRPFRDFSDREIAESMGLFSEYARAWKARESSGAWAKEIEAGTAAKVAAEDKAFGGKLEEYPAHRAAKFEKAVEELRTELERRKAAK